MFLRCLSVAVLLLASASPVLAQIPTISVNASYSLQVPATGDENAVSAQEKALKRSMYERAARECDDLKATIALTCQITSIGVSTQLNRNLGSPPQIYVSANVQMQITAK